MVTAETAVAMPAVVLVLLLVLSGVSAGVTQLRVTDAARGAARAAAAAFFFAAPFSGVGGFSWTRRTTGASMVELADFTNSPMSFRCASSVLLETPSSFASSWTRTFATFLLSGPCRTGEGPCLPRCVAHC